MDRRTGARGPAGEMAGVAIWDIGCLVTSVLTSVRYIYLLIAVINQTDSVTFDRSKSGILGLL